MTDGGLLTKSSAVILAAGIEICIFSFLYFFTFVKGYKAEGIITHGVCTAFGWLVSAMSGPLFAQRGCSEPIEL